MKVGNKHGDFKKGRIRIIKNLNRRGGKFFWVIYLNDDWVGKIYFHNKTESWKFAIEDEENYKELADHEKEYLLEAKKIIEEGYK